MFLNRAVLQGGVVSTSPNPQAGGPPLVGCPRLRIQFICSYLPYRRPFLYAQHENAPCRGDRDPLHGIFIASNYFLKSYLRIFFGCLCSTWKMEIEFCSKTFLHFSKLQTDMFKKKRHWVIRGGACKSFVRPGRKQTTATKLGIYSTYSPRSSIHFFACCSNFRKPLKKKKSEGCPSNQATFQLFLQYREQVVVRRCQIRRIGWVIKTSEVQVGQFLLGCKCPVSRDTVVQEQDPLGELPAAFFLQNVLQLHQQK